MNFNNIIYYNNNNIFYKNIFQNQKKADPFICPEYNETQKPLCNIPSPFKPTLDPWVCNLPTSSNLLLSIDQVGSHQDFLFNSNINTHTFKLEEMNTASLCNETEITKIIKLWNLFKERTLNNLANYKGSTCKKLTIKGFAVNTQDDAKTAFQKNIPFNSYYQKIRASPLYPWVKTQLKQLNDEIIKKIENN